MTPSSKDSTSQKFKSDYVFIATREEIMARAKADHEWKMQSLAKNVLSMKTKLARRAFLDGFEARHGKDLADDLRARIIKAHSAARP